MGDGAMSGGERLKGARLFWAAMVLSTANFMVVLDLTIANVSVPHIAGNLGISPSQGTWVITSYAVAEAIVVPLTARPRAPVVSRLRLRPRPAAAGKRMFLRYQLCWAATSQQQQQSQGH